MHARPFVLLCGCAALAACDRPAPTPASASASAAAPASAPQAEPTPGAVTLSAEQIAHLGLVITPAAAADYAAETEGYGLVLGGDVIAQPLTDLITARAAARQSHAAQARMQRLAGTPGADSALARENAARQTLADDAALELAEAKAAAVLGQRPPWTAADAGRPLHELGTGRITVLRLTFPLGSFTKGAPQDLQVSRLDGRGGAAGWHVATRWPAPADAAMPGLSYFAIVTPSGLAAGERLVVHATGDQSAAAQHGVFIPASALVITGGRYWSYHRQPDGAFARVPVDIGRPRPGGYFVSDGIEPGDAVVTAGAGLLLAREMHPTVDANSNADP